MARKRNFTKIGKNKARFIVVFSLIALLLIGMAATMITLDKQIGTETLNAGAYKVGTLNASGKYEEVEGSIYTSDYYNVEGLEITIVDDATVKYSVYFYDEDYNLVSSSPSQSGDYTYTAPTSNVPSYFRLVITPTNDDSINMLEKVTYANQLTVKFDKE